MSVKESPGVHRGAKTHLLHQGQSLRDERTWPTVETVGAPYDHLKSPVGAVQTWLVGVFGGFRRFKHQPDLIGAVFHPIGAENH